MLDLRQIRNQPEAVREALSRRGGSPPAFDRLLADDEEWRRIVTRVETVKARRNALSKEVGQLRRAGGDAEELMAESRRLAEEEAELDEQRADADARIQAALLLLPNIPHSSVPEGRDETENPEVRRSGAPREFSFEPRPHWDIGEALDILDFERAVKISGSRFYVLKGWGARLERALISFMLDLHTTEHGYCEIWPPVLINRESMAGTGQIPKFEFDMYKIDGEDVFLAPTAEVPVTNLHRDEILDGAQLPISYVAYTPSFRKEAGAAGRDTRGMIRVHQFDKVELVKFVAPETSYDELESLTRHAETVLERLGLPYRTLEMCTGDLGEKGTKQYDPEVWMPGQNRYAEISSCSNFEAYQARRANIRFRPEKGAKPEFVHTLNGSGLAVGRTLAALLENYQEEDGSVTIPEALRPYVGGAERICKG